MSELHYEDFVAEFEARKFVEKITSNIKSNQKFGLQIIKPKEEKIEEPAKETKINLSPYFMTKSQLEEIFRKEQQDYYKHLYKTIELHGYNYSHTNKSTIDPTLI